ncbi:hypothetical protein FA13DRAFT_1798512 [Coprinellus micaceus]|uniref:Protein kinase domain-containing protein n=1 Tax=Coprinellus micaceus TaxID=71717 RepID=A0A4Y7SM54_COPMI|nr:hypothetical protein FA13DRAFT_1798512 [Coprinellus micaceus]
MTTSQAFSNEDWYRQLLRKRGDSAQVCIDALQKILALALTLAVHPSQHVEYQWDNWLTALLRLSKRSIRLPSCLYVTGIRQIERSLELQTPTTDIFHGTHRGQRVILKRYRFCTGMLSLEAQNQMLIKEAIIWANHQHIGILPFIGVFRLEDNPLESGLFLVSPFLEHGTIVAYLTTHPHVNRRIKRSLSHR